MRTLQNEDWFSDEKLQRVLTVLNDGEGETRIVGGAVRDALMGRPIGDVDMATTLMPDEVVARARAAGLKPVPTGIDHGTVTVVCEGRPFEVTTLRTDIETFGRHARVRFGTDWAEDAARRDLTINALYATRDGTIIDLVDGLADIDSKTVRFIGEAALRIEEDYLRILRFFRFFAWYGGGRPDADGLRASTRLRDGLKTLSAERIWSETRKLLSAPDPSRALLWMRQTGVLTVILPETEKWGIDAIPGLIDAERAYGWKVDPYLRLAAMIPPVADRINAMADRLKLSNAERKRMVQFAEAPETGEGPDAPKLRERLYRFGAEAVEMRYKLAMASLRTRANTGDGKAQLQLDGLVALGDTLTSWEKPQIPIGGGDIVRSGIEPGPEISRYLAALEEWWISEDFKPDRAALAARLEELKGKAD